MSNPCWKAAPGPAPYWLQLDAWTWLLCQLVEQPRLDGCGPRRLVPLTRYAYDPYTGQWHPCALPDA